MANYKVMQGRQKEIKILDQLVLEKVPHFIAIYGRRRIGKTYLIRNYFKNKFCFYHTGIANVDMKVQIEQFYNSLNAYSKQYIKKPNNWFEAFECLKKIIAKSKSKNKIVFIDELPWMDTKRSNFLPALEHFWNSWASARKDIVFIICGSATSYIVKNIFNNKGGLHNRVTKKIKLQPFTLKETKEFLGSKKINWNAYQIVKAYMCLGGIPFYLEALEKGKSIDQNIDELFFSEDGLLNNEFYYLYNSLFKNAQNHIEVIKALATKNKGLGREEIATKIKMKTGGTLTKILQELELSDFIKRYIPIGKKTRDSLYQLTDFYSLFYFNFIENQKIKSGDWLNAIDNPRQRAWNGYAFERVCLAHTNQIKKALGIGSVQTEVSSWQSKSKNGAQIDLLIDRRDQIINLFEIKYAINEFSITKKYARELQNKVGVYRAETKTKKAIFLSMLTTYGLKENKYTGMIQNSLTMKELFN